MRRLGATLVLLLSVIVQAGPKYGTGLIFKDPTTDPAGRQVSNNWVWQKRAGKAADLPEQFNLLDYVPPVDSQGGQGSCVAWATGYYMMAIQHNLALNRTDPVQRADDRNRLSPAFMYNLIHVADDNGAYYSDAFQILHEMGTCSWLTMPYDDGDYSTWPSEVAFREAMRHRVVSDSYNYNWMYIKTPGDLNAVKELLLEGYAPIFSIMVYDPYYDIDAEHDEYTITEGRVGSDPGGHAQCVVGYDDNHETADGVGAFLVVNSWGSGWGNQGYYWLSYEAARYHDTNGDGRVSEDDEAITNGVAYWTDLRTDVTSAWQVRVKLSSNASRGIEIECARGDMSLPMLDLSAKQGNRNYMPFADSYLVMDVGDLFPSVTKDADLFLFECRDRLFDGELGQILDVQLFGPSGGEISADVPVDIVEGFSDETVVQMDTSTCSGQLEPLSLVSSWSDPTVYLDVDVDGTTAYAVSAEQLDILDCTDPTVPVRVGSYGDINLSYGVATDGGVAILADYNMGLQILDVSDPAHVIQLDHVTLGGHNCYKVSAESGMAAVALINSGFAVVDYQSPENTVVRSVVSLPYAYDVRVSGNTVFVADGYNGLQIYDISDPDNPQKLSQYSDGSFIRGVDLSGTTCVLAKSTDGICTLDVTDPSAPALLGEADTAGNAFRIAVSNSVAAVAETETGIELFDFSSPDSPALLGAMETDDYARGIQITENVVYVADRNGGLKTVDITDPANPTEFASYTGLKPDDVLISGNRAVVTSVEGSETRVLAVLADGTRVEDKGSVYPAHVPVDLETDGDVMYLACGPAGVLAVDASDLTQMDLFPCSDAAVLDTYRGFLYVLDSGSGVRILNIADPSALFEAGTVAMSDAASMAVAGNTLCLLNNSGDRVDLFDLNTPDSPAFIDFLSVSDAARILADGDQLYLDCGASGLQRVNLSDAAAPGTPEVVYNDGPFVAPLIQDGTAAFLNDEGNLLQWDVSDPENTYQTGFHRMSQGCVLAGSKSAMAVRTENSRVISMIPVRKRFQIPHVAESNWQTAVIMYNQNPFDVSVRLNKWDDGATCTLDHGSFIVPAMNAFALDQTTFGALGTAAVYSNAPNLKTKLAYRYGQSPSLCEFFIQPGDSGTQYMLPNAIQDWFDWFGIVVPNGGEDPVGVTLTAYRDGVQVGSDTETVQPHTKYVALCQDIWGLDPDEVDMVLINTDRRIAPPISITGNSAQDRHVFFTAQHVGEGETGTVHITHIPSGNWTTTLTAYNSGAENGQITITQWDDNGDVCVNNAVYQVPARGMTVISTASGQLLDEGTGQVVIEGDIQVKLSYRYMSSHSFCELFLDRDILSTRWMMQNSIRDFFSWYGFAIANPYDEPVQLKLTAFKDGEIVGIAGDTLAARTKTVGIASDYWPGLEYDQLDTVVIEADRPIAAPVSITGNAAQDRHVFFNGQTLN